MKPCHAVLGLLLPALLQQKRALPLEATATGELTPQLRDTRVTSLSVDPLAVVFEDGTAAGDEPIIESNQLPARISQAACARSRTTCARGSLPPRRTIGSVTADSPPFLLLLSTSLRS
jgi:hypothetical protein